MVYPNKNNGHNLFGVVKLELYGLSFSKVFSHLSPHIVHPFFGGSSETKKISVSFVEQNAQQIKSSKLQMSTNLSSIGLARSIEYYFLQATEVSFDKGNLVASIVASSTSVAYDCLQATKDSFDKGTLVASIVALSTSISLNL